MIAPFAIMAVWGGWRALTVGFPYSPIQPFLSPDKTLATAIAVSLPYALWNYQGWDAISTIAGEMDNPRRNYPRALSIATLVIAATYAIPAFVGLGVMGSDYTWDVGCWSNVAERVAGPWLGTLVSAMGMVSALGLFASLVLVYSRIPFVMAADGYLPRSLAACNVFGAPTFSLLLCGALYTAVVLIFDDFEDLAEVDVTMFAAVMALELASFLMLRCAQPNLPRPFRVPGGWITAAIFCAVPMACVSVSIFYRASESGVWPVIGKALVMMATAPVMYAFVLWRRTRLAATRRGQCVEGAVGRVHRRLARGLGSRLNGGVALPFHSLAVYAEGAIISPIP